jgi:hypothetical protein
MKKLIPFICLLMECAAGHSQVISQFTWDSNPVTTAVIGPNASSISAAATSSTGGVGGTNGLNPGTPTTNVNMVLPGSPYFDVNGIDISVDFKREETQASFFTRGSSIDFGMNAFELYVNFLVSNGSGGSITVNSGNLYHIPNDNSFHTYRFIYNYVTGVATVTVDGANVYTNNLTAGRPMYWTGAGNVVIGTNMDGSGTNIPVMDNLVVQNAPNMTVLAANLLSFTAKRNENAVQANWSTSLEDNIASFGLERSADGKQFSEIQVLQPTEGTGEINDYAATDNSPISPVGYYRLRMTDMEGAISYSAIQTVDFSASAATINCYPNPTVNQVNIRINNKQTAVYGCMVATIDGKILYRSTRPLAQGTQQIPIDLSSVAYRGMLVISLESAENGVHENFKILKL